MNLERALQAALAFASLIAGVLIGLILADFTAEYTVKGDTWFFRYQTLLTGILAVGAAGWTVLAMMRTDQRQHERHQQQMALMQLSDKLTAERAAQFAHWAKDAVDTIDDASWRQRIADSAYATDEVVDLIRPFFITCREIVTNKATLDVVRLMDAKANVLLEFLTSATNGLETSYESIVACNRRSVTTETTNQFSSARSKFLKTMDRMREPLLAYAKALDQLKDRYS